MKALFNTTWRIPTRDLVKLLIIITPLLIALFYAQTIASWQPLELNTKLLMSIAASFLVTLFIYPVRRITLNLIDILFISFNGWICFSNFYNGLDYRTLYPVYVTTAYYFLIRSITYYNVINRNIIILPVAFTSLLAMGYVLMQHFGLISNNINLQFKNTGFFIHSAPLAGYLIFCFPVLIYAFFHLQKRNYIFIISLIISIIYLFVLYKTYSRAAYFAGFTGLGVYLLFKYPLSNSRKIKRISLWLASALIIIIALYFLYHIRPVSGLGRLFVWKISLNIFKDNPIIGIGYDRFSVIYMKYQAAYFNTNGSNYEKLNAQIILFPFNEFIKTLTESGIIGLLLLLCLFITVLIQLGRANISHLKTILFSSITIIVVFAFFSYPFSIISLQLLFSFFMAIISSITNGKNMATLPFNKYVGSIFCLALGGVFIRDYNKSKKWENAITSINYRKEQALAELSDLHKDFNNYGPFLYDYGVELVRAQHFNKAISILSKEVNLYNGNDQNYFLASAYIEIEKLKKAKAIYLNQYYAEPSNLLPLYQLLLMEIEKGDDKLIKELAKQITKAQWAKKNLTNNEILNNCNKILTN